MYLITSIYQNQYVKSFYHCYIHKNLTSNALKSHLSGEYDIGFFFKIQFICIETPTSIKTIWMTNNSYEWLLPNKRLEKIANVLDNGLF